MLLDEGQEGDYCSRLAELVERVFRVWVSSIRADRPWSYWHRVTASAVRLVDRATEDVRRVSERDSYSHDQHIKLWIVLYHGTKLLASFAPVVELIVHLKLFIIGVEQSLPLHQEFTILLQVVLYFLALVPANINRVAALAVAYFAAVLRQSGPSLHPWYLAKAALA